MGGLFVLPASSLYIAIQRYLDILGSIIILVALSPVMFAAAVAIKLDSRGAVLIRQERVGINRRQPAEWPDGRLERRRLRTYGKHFTLYKLRTMYENAEAKTGPVWARQNDERITRVGRILRKTHLDEVPQFFNVLRGDMSIVGPRPERPLFTEQLTRHIGNYTLRLMIKPGITGLAQIRYRYASSIEDTRKKLRYDLLYIRRRCLMMDLSILLNTVNLLFITDKGAR